MMNQLFKSILIAAIIMLSSHKASAYDFRVDGVCYNIIDANTVEVTSSGTSPNYNDVEHLVIPAQVTHDGRTYQVVSIGFYGLTGASDLKALTISEGLISIGQCGLNGLSSITELTLPSSLLSVGGWAFENLDNVRYINCLAKKAPIIDGYWFHNKNAIPQCPFYVPDGSLASYLANDYWSAFNLQGNDSETNDDIDLEADAIVVGSGKDMTEVEPFFNWWKKSYVGNEVIYLKEELEGLNPGDTIVSLTYKCSKGSASGGNFNFRLKNTTQSSFPQNVVGSNSSTDTSLLAISCDDQIHANVTPNLYIAGDRVTVVLTEPFIYDGENIMIDVRNTAPAASQGWCYFEGTKHTTRRDVAWRNANSENCEKDGFHVDYTPFGIEDYGVYPFDGVCIIPNVTILFRKYVEQNSIVIAVEQPPAAAREVSAIYTVGGQRVTDIAAPGVHIVRYTDGTTAKIKR